MNNYYLTSQLVAQHQNALIADVAHRAQVKNARAARKTSAASDAAPRSRRLSFGRPAHAAA